MPNRLAAQCRQEYLRSVYEDVLATAYFDAIGMQGWDAKTAGDGIRLYLDLEDMGRFGLLIVAGGVWDGQQILPAGFTLANRCPVTAPASVKLGHENKALPPAPGPTAAGLCPV